MVASKPPGTDGRGRRSLEKQDVESEPGLLLDFIASELLLSFACPLYRIVNYQKGGSLVEAYQKGGDEEVMRFAKDHLEQFMCQSEKKTVGNQTHRSRNEVSLPLEGTKENRDLQDFVLSEKVCWRREYRGLLGESPLHVLIFCNTPMHINIARLLLKAYPALATDVIEGDDYRAFKNFELVKTLVASGANIFQRAMGRFFLPYDQQRKPSKAKSDFRSLFYMGEYPLAWAACHDDESTYNLLLKHGAHPDMKDSFGNSVLHVVVIQNKLSMYGYALRHPVKPAHDNILNNYGLTPLTLACKLGRNEIFREMLELSAIEFWRYSNITCAAYPLSALDSISPDGKTNQNSALTIILNGTSKEHLDMLDGEVIQRILEEKWKTFARQLFLKRLILMLLHLLLLSVALYLRPSAKISLRQQESDATNIVRFCAELGACSTCGAFVIFQEVKEIKSRGLLVFLKNLSGNVPKAIFLLSDIFILLCIFCRLADGRHLEDCFFALAATGSWIYLLFFAGAIRLTGPFITMISKMLTGDMFRFSIIYVVFLLGFTQAFSFVSKNSEKDNELPETYSEAWMSLIHHTLGVYEYGDLDDTVYPMLSRLVFTVFMVLMPILLLNMLIAMMGTTYIKVIAQSEREWMRQWARIVLSLERAVSQEQAKDYLNSYSLALPSDGNNNAKQQRAVLVIKTKPVTKAKQRKRALSNWKRVGKRLISAVRQCGGTAAGVHAKLLSGTPLADSATASETGTKYNSGIEGLLGNALQQLDFAHDLGLSSIIKHSPQRESKIIEKPKAEHVEDTTAECPRTDPDEHQELRNAETRIDFGQEHPEDCHTPDDSNRLIIEMPLHVQSGTDDHNSYTNVRKDATTQYDIYTKKCDASTITYPVIPNLHNVKDESETSYCDISILKSVLRTSSINPPPFCVSCSEKEETSGSRQSTGKLDADKTMQYHKCCQADMSQILEDNQDYATSKQTGKSHPSCTLHKSVKHKKTNFVKRVRRKKVYEYNVDEGESESDTVESKNFSQNNLSSNSNSKKQKILKLYKRRCRKNRVSDTV